MLDSLAALVITFAVMSLISVVGVVLLYLLKNEKVKKGIIYFLSIWSIVIAYCNIVSVPEEMTGEILRAGCFGILGIAAVLVQLCMKNDKKMIVSKILVTFSVIAGMLDCFVL